MFWGRFLVEWAKLPPEFQGPAAPKALGDTGPGDPRRAGLPRCEREVSGIPRLLDHARLGFAPASLHSPRERGKVSAS